MTLFIQKSLPKEICNSKDNTTPKKNPAEKRRREEKGK
jgi:hypothetical protein